jgi:hypothetical protein
LEQSGIDYVAAVKQMQAYKSVDQLKVHAIAGDSPGGCQGAEDGKAYEDAAQYTGGVLLSVCEDDWTSHMSLLAASMVGVPVIQLDPPPTENTIEVRVGGVVQTSGWVYDEAVHTMLFDGTFAAGTEVVIDYKTSTCD